MSQQISGANVLEETTIVDADVHLSRGISVDEVASHMDEPYESRVLSEYCYPASTGSDWDPYMGEKIEGRALDSPETVQEDLVDGFHVDYPILNTISGAAKSPNTDLAVELMRANNRVILEKFLDPSDFYGLACIAPQDPEAAAEEIDRLGDEDQIIGLFVESFAQNPPLGDSSYDVMYEAAEKNDLTIAFHGGAATTFKYDFPIQNQGLEQFLEIHTLAHLWQSTLALTSLIVEGVPEKFPDLNFVFLEAGISWVPYMMWRLNKEYSIRRSEAPLLEKSPEEYIRDQFYFASQPLGEPNDPTQMPEMIDILGTESVMFASDYPHWDFDHPDELGQHLQQTFTAEERQQILGDTPAEAFGINI
ncbi:amidohydrolase family protein [Natronomonas amylolytica]|uniref:amidohydrolase family protein n=1 Tax=Natronomonas amylolytica TaxID=3108498 RepID=UPI00300BE284